MADVCRNCGKLAGLPSGMAFTKHGSICSDCHAKGRLDPPFDITEEYYQGRKSVKSAIDDIFDQYV